MKAPHRRYGAAGDLADDLDRWLKNHPILARRVSAIEKVWLWCKRRPTVAGSVSVLLLSACIVTGVVIQSQKVNNQKRASSLVESVLTAPPDAVPYTIENLNPLRKYAVPVLRKQFEDETADPTHRLRAAMALAEFGQVEHEYLIGRIVDAPPGECANIVNALRRADAIAITALRESAKNADRRKNWRNKARFAMVALHLKSPELAREICKPRPDPIQRTLFIDECSKWHGDLVHLSRTLADTKDVWMRFAVVLAVGSDADVRVAEKRALEDTARRLVSEPAGHADPQRNGLDAAEVESVPARNRTFQVAA